MPTNMINNDNTNNQPNVVSALFVNNSETPRPDDEEADKENDNDA